MLLSTLGKLFSGCGMLILVCDSLFSGSKLSKGLLLSFGQLNPLLPD
jgi:hypothetical protein